MKLDEKMINALIEKTNENLRLRNNSDTTIKNYDYALKSFFNNCKYKGDLKDFTEEDFLDYIRKEFIDKGKSTNTYNVYIAAIKKMFLVNFRKTFINDLIPRAKMGKRLIYAMPKENFDYILQNETNLKHKCWLALAFYSGLRAYEVATIKIEDIFSKEHYLKVIGKRNKERKTILYDRTISILREYYKTSGMTKKTGYLFEGIADKEHICERTIVNYFISLKDEYNLDDRYTFHSLRHGFATYFLLCGGNLYDLQKMLGHENISTTSIYLHIAQDFIKMVRRNKNV